MDHVSGVDKYKTAQTYLQSERWSSAHSLLSEAIYFKPEYAEAYLQRAEIEQNIYKNYAAAVADYNAVIAYADTVLPDVYFNRGKCYYQLEQFQKAEQDMSKTLLLTNAIPNAYFTRGEVRLLYLRKFPEAVADFTSYLQTGSGTNVQRGEALMYRGFAQYMTRQYPAAISDFEQSLAADSLNARTYYLYGKAEAALQDTGSACRHFVRSYNLGYAAAELDLKELCLNKRYK
ncbi:MAG: tetratricopeptide repeat protein [Hymenobacteraceae bacterium]|nr:tetratricopeptide repeat protein [Hymenobacteraceae bacterium]MDX5396504.1 tetratricopeptide repeat protein [Hymenobacteraceae bacterium]MDX5512571.1 tetratricopeptide repeat protein [Hymenobacteraceae bacterium]